MIRAGLISLLIAVVSGLPTIWAHSRGADTALACTSVAAVAFALYFFAHGFMEHFAPAEAVTPETPKPDATKPVAPVGRVDETTKPTRRRAA